MKKTARRLASAGDGKTASAGDASVAVESPGIALTPQPRDPLRGYPAVGPGEGGFLPPDTRHPTPDTRLSPTALRWRAIRVVAWQELREAVFGWTLYLTAAVAVLVGVVLTYNAVRSVADSGLEIVTRPFYSPLLVATSLAALYLAGWAALSIARPRDQGALRVLFFAPIDALGLLGAHAAAALLMFGVFWLMTIPLLVLLAAIVNLPLSPLLLLGTLVSPAFLAPAVAIGLFISAIAPSGRSAIFLFVAVLAVVLAVQVGYSALLQIPPTSRYYDALLFLRELLRAVQATLTWVSPLALLSDGLDAAFRADWRDFGLRIGAGLIGAAVWLALAAWALRRRGVLL